MSASSAERSDQDRTHRTLAEIAALLVLALVGLVIYNWITMPGTPPVIQLRQSDAVRADGGQFYVPFTVTNTGGNTAQMVQVVAELSVNGKVVEDGQQEIDFLAVRETADGAFVFTQDPQAGELTLRVASYQEP